MNTPSNPKIDDLRLEARISGLHLAVELWARSHDLWHDCGFQSAYERSEAEPGDTPAVTIMWFEGPLFSLFNGYLDDDGLTEAFYDLIASLGFEYELHDHVSMGFYAIDPVENSTFAAYFRWRWICGLVEDDFADVYEEIYAHFAEKPEDLHRLEPREFEILVARALAVQGFDVGLGPGRSDQGVDLRLLQKDPLGDIMTLVQIKRYAPHRKIRLEAVQALFGATIYEGAQRSLFVTTSEYLPGVRNWAARLQDKMQLTTSADVLKWCAQAKDGVIQDKSKLVAPAHVNTMLMEASAGRRDRIFHASTGYNVTTNAFALLLKETRHAALLMSLPNVVVSHDGYGQAGLECPAFQTAALNNKTVWRARRKVENGKASYWDGRNLYSVWNGQPVEFNHCD